MFIKKLWDKVETGWINEDLVVAIILSYITLFVGGIVILFTSLFTTLYKIVFLLLWLILSEWYFFYSLTTSKKKKIDVLEEKMCSIFRCLPFAVLPIVLIRISKPVYNFLKGLNYCGFFTAYWPCILIVVLIVLFFVVNFELGKYILDKKKAKKKRKPGRPKGS